MINFMATLRILLLSASVIFSSLCLKAMDPAAAEETGTASAAISEPVASAAAPFLSQRQESSLKAKSVASLEEICIEAVPNEGLRELAVNHARYSAFRKQINIKLSREITFSKEQVPYQQFTDALRLCEENSIFHLKINVKNVGLFMTAVKKLAPGFRFTTLKSVGLYAFSSEGFTYCFKTFVQNFLMKVETLDTLTLDGFEVTSEQVNVLRKWPPLNKLKALNLPEGKRGHNIVEPLFKDLDLAALTRLSLNCCRTNSDAAILGQLVSKGILKKLSIKYSNLEAGAIVAFCEKILASQLIDLDLSGNEPGCDGLLALFKNPSLQQSLKHLTLSYCKIDSSLVPIIFENLAFIALEELNLSGNLFEPELANVLTKTLVASNSINCRFQLLKY